MWLPNSGDDVILQCPECALSISVSLIPGGNPAVMLDSDKYARSWQTCAKCKHVICSDCLRKRGGLFRQPKCECEGTFSQENNDYWYVRAGAQSGVDPELATFFGRLSAMSRSEAAAELRRAGYPSSMIKRYGLE